MSGAEDDRDYPRPRRLRRATSARRTLTIGALAYLFYLALGGFAGGLDYLTGAASAVVVALGFARVTFPEEPRARRSGGRVLRLVAFLPLLAWEIATANLAVAYLTLHPSLPIDPTMEWAGLSAESGLETAILADSITLTPGTVTVDVGDDGFLPAKAVASAKPFAGKQFVKAGTVLAVGFVAFALIRAPLSHVTPVRDLGAVYEPAGRWLVEASTRATTAVETGLTRTRTTVVRALAVPEGHPRPATVGRGVLAVALVVAAVLVLLLV